MKTYLLARNPTDSVTGGFLPAALRLGLDVTVVTDDPEAHRRAYAASELPVQVGGCEVTSAQAVVDHLARAGKPAAVFSNSDHLQVQTALAAAWFDLPGKDWRSALRCRNKALMRRAIARSGLDTVTAVQVLPGEPLADLGVADLPFPCVVKPQEGVASEDVVLVADAEELAARVVEIRGRRGGPLMVEEFLDGPLHTLETLGDGTSLRVLGGFRTDLSPPPHFVERGLRWCPDLPAPVRTSVLDQLRALGVGFGACHTEFVVQGDRARLIEVNDRIIGDHCDFLLADVLDEAVFDQVLRVHLGERLPPPPPRSGTRTVTRTGRVDYVCAERSGVLRESPPAIDRDGPVRLRYRPLRAPGATVTLTGTNRDYLGALRTVGNDTAAVDGAAAAFLAAHRWEVRP